MNNKSILVVILATLLALLCAFFIMKKNNAELPNIEEKAQIQQEVIEAQNETNTNEIYEDKSNKDDIKKEVGTVQSTVTKEPTSEKQTTKHVFEKTVVQEGSIVEEVEDHGIRRNNDGTYEITREFKIKSPMKYSFVDFGFLEKVSK